MQRHSIRAVALALIMVTSVLAGVPLGATATADDGTDGENWDATGDGPAITGEYWPQGFAEYEGDLFVGGAYTETIYQLNSDFEVIEEYPLEIQPSGLVRDGDGWLVPHGPDMAVYRYDETFDEREEVIDSSHFSETEFDESPWNVDLHDDRFYIADDDQIAVFDREYEEVDRIDAPAETVIGLHIAGGNLYLTGADGDTVTETTLEGDTLETYDIGATLNDDANGHGLYNGHWYVGDLHDDETMHEFHADVETDATVSGTVTDQDGQPVPNATVAAVGVLESGLESDDLEAEADALLSDLDDPLPDAWDSEYDLESHTDADDTYALVHSADDWGVGTTHIADSSVESPRLSVPAGDPVVLSLWDPSADGGLLENQVDGSFPGATTDGEIRLEQLAGSGDTVADRMYETSPYATTTGANPLTETEHHAVETRLPTGVYRVAPADGGAGYVFTVGEPGEIASAIADEMRDEAGALTDRADRIRELEADETLVRETARTDSDGEFELSVDERAVTVQLEAMKADGDVLEGVAEPSLEDLREARLGGYNGSVYLPAPDGERVDVPAEDVDVRTYRAPDVPLEDIDSFGELQAFLEDQRLSERVGDVLETYDERLAEMERDRLEAVYRTHRGLLDVTPGAEDDYLERSAFDTVRDADELTADELARETEHMQAALAAAGTVDPPALEDAVDVSNGELALEYPLPDGLEIDSVVPEIQYADGSSERVADDDYTVESGEWLGGATVVLESVPVDGEVADVRLVAAGEDGVLEDRVPVGGPAVEAVQFSTLAPGADERVSVGVDGGDLRDVDVVDPDGESVAVNASGERVAFNTDGAGVYDLQLTVGADGGERVIRESVRALEQPRSEPATVRVGHSAGGHYAVVGEVLETATVETDRGTTSVTAVVPGDESMIGSLHIKPDSAVAMNDHDLEIAVVEGSDDQPVSSHIETVVHFDSYGEDAIAWRGSDPITQSGDTRYGEVQRPDDGEKGVLRTYTDSDGTVTIRTVDDPSTPLALWHWMDTVIPAVSWPLESGGFVGEKAVG